MELKKVMYNGLDTIDVTEKMEAAEEKMAQKGWREYRVDMLSSSTVEVTYVKGEIEEEEEEDEDE